MSSGAISVLHVDDEQEFGEIVAMHLERIHDQITVTTVGSATAGLERLAKEPFDCVVSDHDMPDMDGLEFLRRVRADYPDLPFLLFTGKGNEEIASDAISAGVTEYLQKGVGTDQYAVLANRIERAVSEKRAKTALEESERMLSTLISNLPGMVYRARNARDWPMEFVSDGASEIVGHDADTLEGGAVAWGSLVHPSDVDHRWEQVQTSVTVADPFEVSYRVETADGEIRWLWERGRVVDETDDGVAVIEGFVTDITARRERERELEREREFTEDLIDAIDDAFYLIGLDGSLIRWNDTLSTVTGYTDEELSGMDGTELLPESYHGELESILGGDDPGDGTFEAPLLTNDGREIPYEFRGSVIKDRDGAVIGIAGIGRDITERQDRQRKLERYETLVENVGDAMYVLDADGTVRVANEAMADHLGYDREEIVGAEPTAFMPAADVRRGTELIQQLHEDDDRGWETFEMHTIDAEGTRTVNENKIAPLYDDGEFAGSVGVIRDISDRKERERELERYETIVQAVGDPVYTLDEDGVFTFVNEAIEPLTGYSPPELIGDHIEAIMTDDDVDRGRSRIRKLIDESGQDHVTLEMDVVTKWGEQIPCENNMALLPTGDGVFSGSAGVIRNIAERKQREQQLSEFASVVSHDLRNPLNVVQGRLGLAIETGEIDHLDDAVTATDRMERLIEELLTLAREGRSVGETRPVDLGPVAEQAWTTVDAPAASLTVAGAATVEADPERLRELFGNLFRNAVEHGREDVTVEVGPTQAGFYVADDGRGIPPEERERVFERGHTTNVDGTGFGLAIVEDIATAHGWTIDLGESDEGGARFEFTTSPGPADR